MDFEFSLQESQRFDQVADFARERWSKPREQTSDFDRDGWQQLAGFGMTGLPIPQQWSGAGASALDTTRAIEALSYGGADSGLVFSMCAHLFTCAVPIWKAGSEEQCRRFLMPLAQGSKVGANGTTEEDVGSDMGGLKASAVRHGDHYVLNGAKCFASNAPVADMFVVYATVNPGAGFSGLTAFIVERGAKGLHVGPPDPKIGLERSPFAKMVFKDCEVPIGQRLGGEGAGSTVFAESMRWERACLFALYVGVMQRQLERCVKYAKGRQQFGQSIGKFQSVANRLVDMKLRLETSRLLAYRAAWLLERGRRCDLDIALSKLHVSESAVASALDAIQIHGGRGCLRELGVEAELRDAIPGRIFSGTSEIQRVIAARCMGL